MSTNFAQVTEQEFLNYATKNNLVEGRNSDHGCIMHETYWNKNDITMAKRLTSSWGASTVYSIRKDNE